MTTKTDKRLEREQRMYDVLKRIARYQTPQQLQRGSEKEYGLPYEEALEYSYENVLQEAAIAVKGMRRPS